MWIAFAEAADGWHGEQKVTEPSGCSMTIVRAMPSRRFRKGLARGATGPPEDRREC